MKQRQRTLPSSVSHVLAIKKECLLNTIPDFQVLTNYGLGVYIVLEGVVLLEIGCVLYEFVRSKYFTIFKLNICMVNYFAKNTVDCKNKPLKLNALDKIGGGLSPSIKASQ